MSEVVFITNTDGYYAMLKKALLSLETECLLPGEAEAWMADDFAWSDEWTMRMADAKVVLIEWMGVSLEVPFLQSALALLKEKGIPYKIHAGEEAEGNASEGFTPKDHVAIGKYGVYGGIPNFKNMWLYLLNRYAGKHFQVEEPQPMAWNGIYHPRAKKLYRDLAEYQKDFCHPDWPTIGMIFYRNEWLAGNLAYQDAMIAEAERQHLNLLAVFSHGVKNPEMGAPGLADAVERYFQKDGKTIVDCVINTIKFSFTSSGSLELSVLERLDVPLLQAYTLMRSTEEWRESIEGMSPVEVAISVTMPEFDGVIHGVPIAGKYRNRDNVISYRPIAERISLMISKAKKWSILRHKPNREKKVAIVFHNYPPTNSNIGTALGMDSPESIRLLLARLRQEGYRVDWLPKDSESFMKDITSHATNDRRFMSEEMVQQAEGKLSREDYMSFFRTLPEAVQGRMKEGWGDPPGDVFFYDTDLLIPGMRNGNVFITVQPPRGFGEDSGKIYHDPVAPPTHHYLAFYHWLRDVYHADVLIHVGTHGSVEWLPGKAAGLAETDYSAICLSDMPNLYHYVITVIGEGIQAKRRSAACLIDYLTPPISTGGLYDELAELESLLDEYLDFKDNEKDQLEDVETLIREKASACHMEDVKEEGDFGDYVMALHNQLTDIKNMQIRVGLHVLGKGPEGKERKEYLFALTRLQNGKVPSLCQTLAGHYEADFNDLLENSTRFLPKASMRASQLADAIREWCFTIFDKLESLSFASCQVEEVLGLYDFMDWQEEEKGNLLAVCRYICDELVPHLQQTEEEISHTLHGLAGRYILPSAAGAPTNGRADVLPTGRNFYGVDPQTLPTKTAWAVGKRRAEGVIEQYIADEGQYPETVGMVMGSDMRTHGVSFAQFLVLLGIRPIWQAGSGRVIGLEPIPLSELKRPRIDVLARITGMMRDSMPCVVTLLDKAAKMAAELEESEEDNFVRKHVKADAADLEKEGIEREEAFRQAMHRIFGCPPGGYGAGVGYLLEEKNWENLKDLSDVYVRWSAHVYGEGESGAFMPGLFKKRLSQVDATVMGIDNREINLLSSDDFNSYHGGLIAGVRTCSGKMPRTYCADSTDESHVVVRTIADEVKRVFRGEIMNPKFIEGMKAHGYKGAADMGNYVAHCYQWDATTEVMDDWMYDDLARKYALDPDIRKWMEKVNPWALDRIASVLLEAEQRGMWKPSGDLKEELQALILEVEGEMEGDD